MSATDNKAIVSRYREEVWNEGNLDAVDDYIASNYVRHDPGLPEEVSGPEAVKGLVSMYRAAFPDLHLTLEDMFAEGDKVVQRLTGRGTHQGELMGIPPIGKQVTVTMIEIFRLVEGKIAEQWVSLDNLGMLQQLGVIPPMGEGEPPK